MRQKFPIFWDHSELTKPFRSGCRPWQDRRTENRGSAHAMAKNFFLLIFTYYHLLRAKTCFLVIASLSHLFFVRCAAKKQKEICCAINTNFSVFWSDWKRNAQHWIIYFSYFECFSFVDNYSFTCLWDISFNLLWNQLIFVKNNDFSSIY